MTIIRKLKRRRYAAVLSFYLQENDRTELMTRARIILIHDFIGSKQLFPPFRRARRAGSGGALVSLPRHILE